MNAETERVYRALRQSYLTEAPARLAELRKEAEAFEPGKPGGGVAAPTDPQARRSGGGAWAARDLRAGARDQNWLADTPSQTAESADHLQGSLALLSRAVDAAGQSLEPVGVENT